LARITKPSGGEIDIYGRLGTLLEIGTGFHPELTGRENIFLNGTILGMKVREIKRKFDEIVAFSEIERFLETPVKHYSSGMYLRLAFSVAAHFEPEVLLMDEIIAVGDISFQEKCFAKMRAVSQEGRTIFLVSHNLDSIRNLCQRVFLLSSGRLWEDPDPHKVIATYVKDTTGEVASGTI
jgi:lipopolysaccharide transport system ATP-binding protein